MFKTMKPFDLVRALAGEPVVMRNGTKVEEFHYFETAPDRFKVVVVSGGSFYFYNTSGQVEGTSYSDLFMAPKKRTVWVNVWEDDRRDVNDTFGRVYSSEKLANLVSSGMDEPRIGGKAWPLEIDE
jgi:hypothetical protein